MKGGFARTQCYTKGTIMVTQHDYLQRVLTGLQKNCPIDNEEPNTKDVQIYKRLLIT